ncbi:MAG: hypothetical protein WCL61_02460 [bacterium]
MTSAKGLHRVNGSVISHKAMVVALMRAQITGLRYAPQIANLCGANDLVHGPFGDRISTMVSLFACLTEIQTGAVDFIVSAIRKQSGITNILELEADLSPRGMIASDDDDGLFYTETHSGQMAMRKREIARGAMCLESLPANLQILMLDATSGQNFRSLSKCFFDSPVLILTSGLLADLRDDQKLAVVRNIHALLCINGGAWVATDIAFTSLVCHVHINMVIRECLEALVQHTGGKIINTRTETKAQTLNFLQGEGFSVQSYDQLELVREPKLQITDIARPFIEGRELWVMHPRSR